MKLIPWQRSNKGLVGFDTDFDELWNQFLTEWNHHLKDEGGYGLAHLPKTFRRGFYPAMNVSESEQGWLIALELPGLEEKDIDIQLMGRQLMVSGERKWEEEKKEKDFHRMESQYGTFRRSFTLPEGAKLDAEAIEATFDKGFLRITVPKLEPTPTKKIKVKS